MKIIYRTIIETELDLETGQSRILKQFTIKDGNPRKPKPVHTPKPESKPLFTEELEEEYI